MSEKEKAAIAILSSAQVYGALVQRPLEDTLSKAMLEEALASFVDAMDYYVERASQGWVT